MFYRERGLTLREAKEIAGGPLNFPSKMPGTSFSLPASACLIGAKLAKVAGTVCSKCYALTDRHAWINPMKSQQRHLAALHHPRWIEAVTKLLLHAHRNPTFRIDLGIKHAKKRGLVRFRQNVAGFHRWHDAGDLQSVEHLSNICEVARRTPKIKHWLPTQELGMVNRYIASGGTIPDNLVIRVSSVMINDTHRRAWPQISSAFTGAAPSEAHVCPAPTQDNRCGACRACWSRDVAHIAYHLH